MGVSPVMCVSTVPQWGSPCGARRYVSHGIYAMKASSSIYLSIRGLRYHVRTWGDARAPKMFMLHGWMDVSASFQFVVDELRHDWHVIAPDWRGFGLSEWSREGYWFPDYIADL